MANVKINSIPSNKLQVVESITEAKQLERKDSGKVFVFDQDAFDINLPKLSTDIAGWNCTMIRRTGHATNNMLVKPYSGDNSTIVYIEMASNHSGPGSSDIVVYSTGNGGTNTMCVLKFFTDGAKWYAHLYGQTADTVDSNG